METTNILFSYNLDMVIKGVGVILAFISIMFVIRTFTKNMKINRAEFLLKLHHMYLNDKKMMEVFNDIEYMGDQKEFENKFYDAGENGYKLYLEKFFAFFEYVLFLKQKRILTESETTIYDYMLERIITNEVIKEYFRNVLLPHVTSNNYPKPYPKLTKAMGITKNCR